MGHGGWWIQPKQKYVVRYGLSPYAQNPFKNAGFNAFFNTLRRVKGSILVVGIPIGSYLWMWKWANSYNEWLYTKAGRTTLEKFNE